jgi:hypothetical protein
MTSPSKPYKLINQDCLKQLEEEKKIFKDFSNEIKKELKNSSLYKFREEILRFLFYKTLLKNSFECENIEYETNFENGKNDKVDIKFENNYLEFKFDTLNLKNSIQKKEINNRPKTMRISNSIFDLFKLKYGKGISKNKKNNFYFIYSCDIGMLSYINKLKNLNFLENNKIDFKEYEKKFKNYLNKKELKYKKEKFVEFKIIDNLKIKDNFNKELNLYLLKIK